MKNKIYAGAAVMLLAMVAVACKKELPPVYGDGHGVYVDSGYLDPESAAKEYKDFEKNIDSVLTTFLTAHEETITVYVKVMTKGRLDYVNDRYFDAMPVDSLPTDPDYVQAVPEEYEFGEMVVKAGMEYGLLPITLKKSDRVMKDNVSVQVMVELVPSADFPYVGTYHITAGRKDYSTYFKVKWNNLIQMPPNWTTGYWSMILGTWNPVMFQFLMDTLKETAPDWVTQAPSIGFPLNTTNYNMAISYRNVLREALVIYKANNKIDPVAYPPLYNPNATTPETWISF
jgi:hypothetical protein